jgi:hypothetical protein
MKCPHCSKEVRKLDIEKIQSIDGKGTSLKTVALVCPDCNKIIDVMVDPFAMAGFIAETTAKAL